MVGLQYFLAVSVHAFCHFIGHRMLGQCPMTIELRGVMANGQLVLVGIFETPACYGILKRQSIRRREAFALSQQLRETEANKSRTWFICVVSEISRRLQYRISSNVLSNASHDILYIYSLKKLG